MKRRNTKNAAKARYRNAQACALADAKRLVEALSASPMADPSWGDVGDIEHLAARLREVCDQRFNEGEYAA